MSKTVEVIFNSSSCQISAPTYFTDFLELLYSKISLPKCYRIQSSEISGNLITINDQEDYQAALSEHKSAKFIIMKINQEEKKKSNEISEKSNMSEEGTCFKCNGLKVNKKGNQCKVCNGTGNINKFISLLTKNIKKSLREEVSDLAMKMSSISQSNVLNSSVMPSSFSSYSTKPPYCSICHKEIGIKSRLLCCIDCANFYVCESCEDDHSHFLVKVRGNTKYEMELLDESNIEFENSLAIKSWVILNKGRNKWPDDSKLTLIEGESAKVKIPKIDALEPATTCKIVLKFELSENESKYIFQLEGNKKKFGQSMVVNVKGKPLPQYEENKIKEISQRVEKFRKGTNFDKRYSDNMVKILSIRNWNLFDILRCLINSNNDLSKALEELGDPHQ